MNIFRNITEIQQRVQALHELASSMVEDEFLASVVIVCRNNASYLANLLATLDKQTVPKPLWELVVIDQDSQDETHEVVETYIKRKNLRITYIRCSRQLSYGAAVSQGFFTARGKTIVIVAPDRIVDKDFLLAHLLAQRTEKKLAVSLTTHALYTHMFSPFIQHIEGINLTKIFSRRQIQDFKLLQRWLVLESPQNISRLDLSSNTVNGKPWMTFQSVSASLAAYAARSVDYDSAYNTREIADIDFAYRLMKSGVEVAVAGGAISYRQLSPTASYSHETLRADISRFNSKFHCVTDGKSITIDESSLDLLSV